MQLVGDFYASQVVWVMCNQVRALQVWQSGVCGRVKVKVRKKSGVTAVGFPAIISSNSVMIQINTEWTHAIWNVYIFPS